MGLQINYALCFANTKFWPYKLKQNSLQSKEKYDYIFNKKIMVLVKLFYFFHLPAQLYSKHQKHTQIKG